MRRIVRIFGTLISIVFQVIITYLFVVMLGLGFPLWLWGGVACGIIGISFSMVDLLALIGEDSKEVEKQLDEDEKPPLYYRIHQGDEDKWYYRVYSQNHELICYSDGFSSYDGAITGLWYLMKSMHKMETNKWRSEHSN